MKTLIGSNLQSLKNEKKIPISYEMKLPNPRLKSSCFFRRTP